MKCDDLFKSIDALNEKYLRVWEEASNIESPTSYKAGVDEAGKLFIRMAKERKWEIEVLDLWDDEEMNGIEESDYKLYMFDSIHPTRAGYLLWWTPKFEDKLYEMVK